MFSDTFIIKSFGPVNARKSDPVPLQIIRRWAWKEWDYKSAQVSVFGDLKKKKCFNDKFPSFLWKRPRPVSCGFGGKGCHFWKVGWKLLFKLEWWQKKGLFPREFITCPLEGLASNPTLGRSKQGLYDSWVPLQQFIVWAETASLPPTPLRPGPQCDMQRTKERGRRDV